MGYLGLAQPLALSTPLTNAQLPFPLFINGNEVSTGVSGADAKTYRLRDPGFSGSQTFDFTIHDHTNAVTPWIAKQQPVLWYDAVGSRYLFRGYIKNLRLTTVGPWVDISVTCSHIGEALDYAIPITTWDSGAHGRSDQAEIQSLLANFAQDAGLGEGGNIQVLNASMPLSIPNDRTTLRNAIDQVLGATGIQGAVAYVDNLGQLHTMAVGDITAPYNITDTPANPPLDASWVHNSANPIVSPLVAWEGAAVVESSVMYDAGLYKMWYRGGWGTQAIGYATSTNGIAWTKYASNPVYGGGGSGVGGTAALPLVIKIGATFYLYGILSPFVGGNTAFVATSIDGITWTTQTSSITLPGVTTLWGRAAVWVEGATWYRLQEAGPSPWQIYLYTSTDGLTWSIANSGNALTSLQVFAAGAYGGPSLARIENTTLPKIGGVYHLWYHAVNAAGNLPTDIYHATSTDRINWTRTPTTPVVTHTTTGFEIDQVANPSVLIVGGDSRLYYDGDDNTKSTAAIGIATPSNIPAVVTVVDQGASDVDALYVYGGTAAGSGAVYGWQTGSLVKPRSPLRWASLDAPQAVNAATRNQAATVEFQRRQNALTVTLVVTGYDGWAKGQLVTVTNAPLGYSAKQLTINAVDMDVIAGTGTRRYTMTAGSDPVLFTGRLRNMYAQWKMVAASGAALRGRIGGA